MAVAREEEVKQLQKVADVTYERVSLAAAAHHLAHCSLSPSPSLSRHSTIMMMMEEKEGEKDDNGCWLQRSPSWRYNFRVWKRALDSG